MKKDKWKPQDYINKLEEIFIEAINGNDDALLIIMEIILEIYEE